MKKWMVITIILSFITLAGCAKETANKGGSFPYQGSEDEQYVMVTFLSGIEYWKGAFKGMEEAAENLGVEAEYKGADQYDINQQVTVLEQVIAQKPAGILVSAINPDALAAPINKAIEAGIPVVTFDADAPKSKRYAFLATSNYNAGATAARKMADLTGGKGEVGVITLPGQLNHEERKAGFVETIQKEFPNMKVVSIQDGKGDQIKAAQATSGMIQKNPNIAGIFATDATSGVGVGTSVKEANKVGKIHIISFDTDKGTLDMVKAGIIDATLAQGTWNMGYWGMHYLFNLKHNLVHPVSDWKAAKVSPLPPTVDTGVNVVTKENADFYLQQK
ncbi:substrate-binding domain-containing protein [Paenactinomyces guangxiensis]|uniref:Substrate-binding domain-containing protein n=1 Tax=Paenactinomyces guangxiensis TaxID=1490290 RepID=A0A7W2A7E0_9BACL|nr:substrate-binding domain-containing protein [Paenactinomyces guangxiensis]MBA4493039.1 substrate-binding domain-containing protein [Paenactinomyces guangxiensis]MBH8590112.1 substrate-binding domain-containing protein [Paenactinomyces guangxiensis]